jgi:hypothetical protein
MLQSRPLTSKSIAFDRENVASAMRSQIELFIKHELIRFLHDIEERAFLRQIADDTKSPRILFV